MRGIVAVTVGLAAMSPASEGRSATLFNAPPALEVSFRPAAADLRDLDGDVDLDLVVVCEGEFADNQWIGSLVHVFLNPGDGAFPVRADYVVPSAPLGLAIADLNGDGALDLVTANGAPDNLQILLNDSHGGFILGPVIPVAVDPVAVTAADWDGDGDVDLASSDRFGGGVSVAMNDGSAQFPAVTFYPLGGAPSGIASGDVDHDLDSDLLVFLNGVVLLGNDGAGHFGAPQQVISGTVSSAGELCLFDADNHLDLVTSSRVWLGQGNGSFGSTPIPTGFGEGYARGYDFDRDGHKDVVTNRGIALADGQGGLRPPLLLDAAPVPGPVCCGDLNGDQVPDLVRLQAGAAGPFGFAVLLAGRGDGSVATWPRWAAGNSVWALTAADVHRDGLADAVVGNAGTGPGTSNGSVSVLGGTGSGALGTPVGYPAGNFVRATAAGDMNGDGAPEVVVTNRDAGTVSIFMNDASGGLAPRVVLPAGTAPEDVILTDLDGDQNLDIVISNAPPGTTPASVTILYGDGAGGFPSSQAIPLSGNAAVRLVAEDLDGTGTKDLAVVCAGRLTTGDPVNYGLYVLANHGDRTFGPEAVQPTDGLPRAIAVADLDLDQDADLVVTTMDPPGAPLLSGRVQAFLNDGTSGFPSSVTTSHRVDHFNVVCADFNGDTRPDLAMPYLSAGVVSVFLGDGTGSFPSRISAATGTNPRALAGADFNLDGLLDLAVAHSAINEVGILLANPALVTAAPAEDPSGARRNGVWSWPNPFRSHTRIIISAPQERVAPSSVVHVLDATGRQVRSLPVHLSAGGRGEAVWDGRGSSGERLPGGIYLLRVPGETGSVGHKIILIK